MSRVPALFLSMLLESCCKRETGMCDSWPAKQVECLKTPNPKRTELSTSRDRYDCLRPLFLVSFGFQYPFTHFSLSSVRHLIISFDRRYHSGFYPILEADGVGFQDKHMTFNINWWVGDKWKGCFWWVYYFDWAVYRVRQAMHMFLENILPWYIRVISPSGVE